MMNYSLTLQFYVWVLAGPSSRVTNTTDLLGDFCRLATFGLGHTSSFLFGEEVLAYCPEHPTCG